MSRGVLHKQFALLDLRGRVSWARDSPCPGRAPPGLGLRDLCAPSSAGAPLPWGLSRL